MRALIARVQAREFSTSSSAQVGAIILVNSANLEHSAPGTICAIFTALFAGKVVLLIISREETAMFRADVV